MHHAMTYIYIYIHYTMAYFRISNNMLLTSPAFYASTPPGMLILLCWPKRPVHIGKDSHSMRIFNTPIFLRSADRRVADKQWPRSDNRCRLEWKTWWRVSWHWRDTYITVLYTDFPCLPRYIQPVREPILCVQLRVLYVRLLVSAFVCHILVRCAEAIRAWLVMEFWDYLTTCPLSLSLSLKNKNHHLTGSHASVEKISVSGTKKNMIST